MQRSTIELGGGYYSADGEILTLTNVRRRTLSPDLWRFHMLRSLTIKNSPRLKELPPPPSNGYFVRLVSFTLYRTGIERIPGAMLKKMPMLQRLILNENPMTDETVDEVLRNTKTLHYLNISGTNIKVLPKSIERHWKHLHHLTLEDNRNLHELPRSIDRLQQLKSLLISDSPQLERIPEDIGIGLDQLTKLMVQNAGLKRLPESIGQLRSLRSLDVSQNPDLKELPESIEELRNLQILNLSRTGVSAVSAALLRRNIRIFTRGTPMESDVSASDPRLGRATIFQRDYSDPGVTQSKRQVIERGERMYASPPTLLDIVSAYVFERVLED